MLECFGYHATLGAALAWWIQAVAVRLDGGMPRPTYWALAFGFWFLAYHSVWYGFLITAEKESTTVTEGGPQKVTAGVLPKKYGRLTLVIDFIDTTVRMTGFVGLGFSAGHYDNTHSVLLFPTFFNRPLSAPWT